MKAYTTSVWLTDQIAKFCLSNNLAEDLVCRCLELGHWQARDILVAEHVKISALTEFNKIFEVYNAEHVLLHSEAMPDLKIGSFSFYPMTVDMKLGDIDAALICKGLTSVKITQSKQLAAKFVLLYGTQKITFYIVQGLYPWILVCCSTKDKQFSIGVSTGSKSVIKISSGAVTSTNARAKIVAKYYDKLTLVVEQIQKFCCAEDNTLHRLTGSPLDLHRSTNYPDTHKTPVEHMRKAHIRTMSNGKQVTVRETLVCAGCK